MIPVGKSGDGPVWQCRPFEGLDTRTLYRMLALRLSVFVVEQNCPYQELDGKDTRAWHVLGHQAGELAATARILAPGDSFGGASIGRVVTHPACRGQRLGAALMEQAIRHCRVLFPDHPIEIGAQAHLADFYAGFGFKVSSDRYLEDGIPHIEMVLAARRASRPDTGRSHA